MDDNKTGVFFRLATNHKSILNEVAKREERSLQAVFVRALREYILKHHGLHFAPQEEEMATADQT